MKEIFTFVFVSLLLSATATKFKLCGDSDPLVEVSSVSISPVYPGKPLSVNYAAESKIDLPESGIVGIVEVSVFGLKLVEVSFDFCEEFTGVSCPVSANTPFEGVFSYEIPKEVPEGIDLSVKIKIEEDATKEELSCLEVNLRVETSLRRMDELNGSVLSLNLLSEINEKGSTWKAHMSPRFSHYSIEDAKKMNGTVMKWQKGYISLQPRTYSSSKTNQNYDVNDGVFPAANFKIQNYVDDIPKSFDSRDEWPECATVIGRVRDQSDCGACWAFASTEAFNDRQCIKDLLSGDGSSDISILSVEDTLACCSGLTCGLSMGCNGGQPGSAWHWFVRRGVVSGLDYTDVGKGTSCKPYEFKPCAHHVDPKSSGYPECSSSIYPTPKCVEECTDPLYPTSFEDDRNFASKAFSLRTVADIQKDLMLYGPVTAAFGVYSDFLTYESGIYQHVAGNYLGGHAVKIIGWGHDEESGLDYWLVVNSWNDSWGEQGLFRIIRGQNECGIESSVVAGEA